MPTDDLIRKQLTTVFSGTAVSTPAVPWTRESALWVPVVDATDELYLQGSFDTTSANFVRLHDTRSLGTAFEFTNVAGSLMAALPIDGHVPHVRVEMSTNQAADREFYVTYRLT